MKKMQQEKFAPVHNQVLDCYSRYKKMELEKSPFHFLLSADIELNPHQINAFIAAIQALHTGGIILADEVGLGKTIEAGLVLEYVLKSGATHVIITMPASLRKQWEIELYEKFGLETAILDRMTVEGDYSYWNIWLHEKENKIVICSYDYSSKLIKRFPDIKWDFTIIDEAHNFRNVFHGMKRARRFYDLTMGIPKILLTATPIQNSLTDLHGLVSFIDPRIFGDEKSFKERYIDTEDFQSLKMEISPVMYRTLRKDVADYMDFKKRICKTVDFELTRDEIELYERVNEFLKRDILYSIPSSNRSLIILVIRKLLASSSFAVVETFEVLKNRLEKMKEGTKSADAEEGFDLFWSYVEDEADDNEEETAADEEPDVQMMYIQNELDEIDRIIDVAGRIKTNAKITALITALKISSDYQKEHGIDEKAVVFTESKRTQKYIASELRESGYDEEDIILFNGDFTDVMTKDIYNAWKAKNYDGANYGRSVEYKHAIVDYFHHNAKVLICTDAGSEGLNLQFCNTVINYDLPWNPMKIEQRIGRCHRYGQKHDVIAINLLNTQNEADKRVYEILSEKFELFDGVFGSSDIAIGTLESGSSFEKMVLQIYQTCNSSGDFKKAFDKLDRKLNARRDKKTRQLQSLLLTESSGARHKALEGTRKKIKRYIDEVDFWENYDGGQLSGATQYLCTATWGERILGTHGTLFIGAFCDGEDFHAPMLNMYDSKGHHLAYSESEIIQHLEKLKSQELINYTPTEEEKILYRHEYDDMLCEMLGLHEKRVHPVKEYNRRKVENWERIRNDQLNVTVQEMDDEMAVLVDEEKASSNFYEKIDIRKKIEKKKSDLEQFQASFHKKSTEYKDEGDRTIRDFDQQLEIGNPLLNINMVLKF